MKELRWKYLCLIFPHAYRKKSKFGLVTYFDCDEHMGISKVQIMGEIRNMFSCSRDEALVVLDDWINCRDVVHPIPNSTNPDVLISLIN